MVEVLEPKGRQDRTLHALDREQSCCIVRAFFAPRGSAALGRGSIHGVEQDLANV